MKNLEFQIVGSCLAKPFEGKISNESPYRQSCLGHTVGDIVEVNVLLGSTKLKIMSISR